MRPPLRTSVLLAAALATVVVACIDLNTGVDSASLQFRGVPAPSVVVGDTLRDSLGLAVPLTATVTGGRKLRFLPLDTSIRIDSNGYLTARSRDTSASATNIVRVIADAGGTLQTPPQALVVTVRPDQLVSHGGAVPALAYIADAAGTVADTGNRSAELQVRLRHLYTPGEAGAVARDTIVRTFVVRFEIISSAGAIADSALLVSDLGNPTRSDTTNASGVASRRIRLYPKTTATANDSVVVLARVAYRGANIPGSPLRIVLPLRKR